MSKLGFHCNAPTPEAKASIRRTWPKVLKSLSTSVDVPLLTEWRQHRPDGILVYREWFGDNRLDTTVDRVAQLVAGVSPIAHLVNYVETPWNECYQSGPGLTQYAAATVDACNMLHACGHKVIVGNFSVGWPKLTEVPAFYPAIEAGDALGLHEYSAPTLWDSETWHMLYYRRVWGAIRQQSARPIFIGECGIDWGVVDNVLEGWRARGGIDPNLYATQLDWYKGQIERDPYVLGAAIYCCGTLDPHWQSFDVAGVTEVEDVVKEGPVPIVGQGYQKCIPIIGAFLEDEIYHGATDAAKTSLAIAERGYATWRKATNQTTAVADSGETWADFGNASTDGGRMHRIYPPA